MRFAVTVCPVVCEFGRKFILFVPFSFAGRLFLSIRVAYLRVLSPQRPVEALLTTYEARDVSRLA